MADTDPPTGHYEHLGVPGSGTPDDPYLLEHDASRQPVNADLDRELRRARTLITQMQAQLDASDQHLRVQALAHATQQSETLATHAGRYLDNEDVLALAEKFYAFLAARS